MLATLKHAASMPNPAELASTVVDQAGITITTADERAAGTPQHLASTTPLRDDRQAALDALTETISACSSPRPEQARR